MKSGQTAFFAVRGVWYDGANDKILEEAAIMKLIRGARAVVTCDAEDRVLWDVDVRIDGQKVVQFGKGLEAPEGCEVIDGTDKFVYPGLVNTHHHWLRKPPAMPVEVFRKKALASSIERSESRITIQKIRMHSIKTADARLRAAGHLMQVKNHSVHL